MKKVLLVLIYNISGILLLFLFISFIGLLLPKERVETRHTVFMAPPEIVYSIVTNNRDWKYRKDLEQLKIIEQKDTGEIWEEITRSGASIQFTTREKIPYSLYSFDMKSKMFTGYWTANFKPIEKGKTLFIATEHIRIKNPFIKAISYLFFDIGQIMDSYQEDIRAKLDEMNKS